MRVLVASETGMCFGVRAALATAKAVVSPSEVAVHGELVHNPLVAQQLAERGFLQTPETRRVSLPGRGTLLITAHGISDRERRRLLSAGKTLIDTTCPLVERVHRRARDFAAEQRLVIIIGKPRHVEVLGITEDLAASCVVCSAADVRHWGGQALGILSQSTTEPDRFEALVAAIKAANPESDIEVANTICSPTSNRQRALTALLGEIEALVVVGDRSSNNTRALAQRGESAGLPTQRVGRASELDAQQLSGLSVVGLAAGTSVLDESLAEVHAALLAIGCSKRATLEQCGARLSR